MSECEKYQALISEMLDDELNESEKAQLAEHLRICPECASLYKAFSGLSQCIKEDCAEMPSEVHENIIAEIRRADIKKKNQKRKPFKALIATAACAALIIAGAAILSPQRKPSAVYRMGSSENAAGSMETAAAEEASDYAAASENEPMAAAYDSGEDAAVFELPDSDTAPEPAPYENEPEETELIKKNKLTLSPPADGCYTLDGEKWAGLMELISGEAVEIDPSALGEALFTVCSQDNAAEFCIELYSTDTGILYYDFSDSSFYSCSCTLDNILDLLK